MENTDEEAISTEDILPVDPQEPEPEQVKNPALKVGLIVLLLLVAIVGWYMASDRFSPGTTRGIVLANVTQIAPRVSGRVIDIKVNDNAFVALDAPLFQLDSQPFQLAVEQAKVQLRQAHQSIDASSAQLVASQANVAQARATMENTRASSKRTMALAKRGLVPKAKVDTALAQLENAEAATTAALARLDSAQRRLGVVGDDNPQIRAAQLLLEQATYDLLSTTVHAPAPGVITNLKLSVGQFIRAGSPAMTFIEASKYWIVADLRENQLVNVDIDDEVDILFDAVPGRIFRGHVDSIAWGINPGRNEAGGLPVSRPATQWFEPARRMPVRIVLDDDPENGGAPWPAKVRLGGKVHVLVHADRRGHPVSVVSSFMMMLQSYTTALY